MCAGPKSFEHTLKIVVAVGCFLPLLAAGNGVGHEENGDLDCRIGFEEHMRESKRIIASLRAVGRIVQDYERLHRRISAVGTTHRRASLVAASGSLRPAPPVDRVRAERCGERLYQHFVETKLARITKLVEADGHALMALMTPLIFDSRITMSMQAATLLDTAFCIQVGYVTRGVTRSAGPASRCR